MLSVVSILNALLEGRVPRVASLVVVISGGLILAAAATAEDGLQLVDIPNAFFTLIAAILELTARY